jgi:hypothetical protein
VVTGRASCRPSRNNILKPRISARERRRTPLVRTHRDAAFADGHKNSSCGGCGQETAQVSRLWFRRLFNPDLPIALPFGIRHRGSGNTCHVFRIPASGTTNSARPEPDRIRGGGGGGGGGREDATGWPSCSAEVLFSFRHCRPLLQAQMSGSKR